MMPDLHQNRYSSLFAWWALVSGGFAFFLGAFGVAYTLVNTSQSQGAIQIPIPLLAGILLTIAGCCIGLISWFPEFSKKSIGVNILVILMISVSLQFLLRKLFGVEITGKYNPENHSHIIPGVTGSNMSPLSGILFFFSGIALLIINRKKMFAACRHVASVIAFLVFLSGVFSTLAYIYSDPVSLGGTIMPMAFSTSVGMVIAGFAMSILDIENNFITRIFSRESYRATTLRLFIPLAIFFGVAQGLFFKYIFMTPHINNALIATLGSLVLAFMVITITGYAADHFIKPLIVSKEKQKLAEQALQAEYHKAMSLIEAARGLIVLLDPEGKIVLANQRTADVLGYGLDSFTGKTWIDEFVPFSERQKERLWMQSVLVPGVNNDQRNESSILCRNRKERTISWQYRVFRDPQGNISNILASGEDITEQKRLMMALSESENHFRMLYDRAPISYQSLDSNGYILDVNKTWLDNLGYERSEVIGRWMGDFLTPQYQKLFMKRFPVFKEIGSIKDIDFVMIKKDGSHMFVSVDGQIGHTEQGEFKQTHCIVRDVTRERNSLFALQESEERFKSIFMGHADGIIFLDPETLKLSMPNPRFCAMSGYSELELEELYVYDIHPPEELGRMKEIIARQINGEMAIADNIPLLCKDGLTSYCEVNSIRITLHKEEKLMWVFREYFNRTDSDLTIPEENQLLRNKLAVHTGGGEAPDI